MSYLKLFVIILAFLSISILQAEDKKEFKIPKPFMIDFAFGQGIPHGDFEKTINGNANGLYANNLSFAKSSPENYYLGYSYLTDNAKLTSKNFALGIKFILGENFHIGFSNNFMQIEISKFTPYPYGFQIVNAVALFSNNSSPYLDYLLLYKEKRTIRHSNSFFDLGYHYKLKNFTPFITLGIDLGDLDITASQLTIGLWAKLYENIHLNFQSYYLKTKISSIYQYEKPDILLETGMRIGVSYLYE